MCTLDVVGVSSMFARRMIAQAGAGAQAARLLRVVGLDPEAPPDLERIVTEDAYCTLLETIADEAAGPLDFHVRMGAAMRCEDLGVMGLAWKTAPSLADSFERWVRYSRLLNRVSSFDLVTTRGQARLTAVREGQRRGAYLSNEAALVTLLSVTRESAGADLRPIEVWYRHEPLPSASALEAHFGCPVRFGQATDALVFDAAVLGRANRVGDESLHRYFGAQLDQAISQAGVEARLDELVRRQIAECLADGVPRAATVAARLGLSQRTLQRRLSTIGVPYPALVETTRRQLAERLLRETDHSLAEVAFLTGFSEHSAFTRAFKRWTGQAPSAYRRGARS